MSVPNGWGKTNSLCFLRLEVKTRDNREKVGQSIEMLIVKTEKLCIAKTLSQL